MLILVLNLLLSSLRSIDMWYRRSQPSLRERDNVNVTTTPFQLSLRNMPEENKKYAKYTRCLLCRNNLNFLWILASFINQWYFTFCFCKWSFIRNSAEISYLKYTFRTLLNECFSIQDGLAIMYKVDKWINLDLSKANIVLKFIVVRLSKTRVRISFSCSWSWWNVT